MSHIQYTLSRSGRYYYNRRVPKHVVQFYGSFIRLALSKDPVEAAAYAKRLGNVLDALPSIHYCTNSAVCWVSMKPPDWRFQYRWYKPP